MLRKILAAVSVLFIAFPTTSLVMAQGTTTPEKFIIEAPTTAKTGEAIDVTVKAVDKNNAVVTDYRGSIFFVSRWLLDTLPSPARPIPFTAEHQGVIKFSKGVIFKKPGKNTLSVIDVNNSNVTGEVVVNVEEGSASTTTATDEIVIITPANESKIPGTQTTISGKARKNSKIALFLNGAEIGTVVTDDAGIFTKEVSNVSQENNIIKASLIDADGKVIATSPEVKFIKSSEASSIYGVTISPSNSVAASEKITVTIEAVKGLSDVLATIDGTALPAKETSEGKYTLETTAPATPGSYPVSVTAKTLTSQSVVAKDAVILKVEEKKSTEETLTGTTTVIPLFKNVKTETKGKRVNFSFMLENTPTELSVFRIDYGNGKSVTTHPAKDIVKDGIYNWYVDGLEVGDYTFKINGINASGTVIEGLTSEPIMATIGFAGCTIGNVGKISIETNSSKSVLTWPSVEGATGYNVYRVGNDGKYSLIQHTKEPTYAIFLSKGAVTYADFAVKATCGEGTESGDYSQASRVQTGPGVIAFVLVFSAISAAVILRRRSA